MSMGPRGLRDGLPLRLLFACVFSLAAPGLALAQFSAGGPSLQVEAVTETDGAHAGKPLRAAVVVTVQEGWHVNAHEPLEPFLIPTALSVEPIEGITIVDTVYPEPEMVKFSFSEDLLAVYEHEFAIGIVLDVAEDLSPGDYALEGTLKYQACNDRQCWAPATRAVEIPFKVVDASSVLKPEHEAVFDAIAFTRVDKPVVPTVPAAEETAPMELAEREGSAAARPSAEGGQDLLKDFSVAGQAGGIMDATTFLAFIDGAESGVAPSPSHAFEGKSIWWVLLLTIAGGLALNLTPCVLPIIPINLAIIGAGAQASSRLRGFALGGAYGAGIALVYGILGLVVVLTTASFGAINSSWLFNFAVAALFVVLGLAMFDVITIDFSRFQSKIEVKKKGRGNFIVALAMGAVAAFLAGACVAPVVISVVVLSRDLYAKGSPVGVLLPFLLGLGMALPWPLAGAGMSMLPKPGKWMVRVKYAFGVFILVMALYYGNQSYGLFADRYLVDPDAVQASVEAMDEEGWTASLEEGLALARQENRYVLIDFWATWCKNCLVMNKTTLKDPDVNTRLADYVKVKYQAEFPDQSPTRELLQEFDQYVGLPFYVILRPNVAS